LPAAEEGEVRVKNATGVGAFTLALDEEVEEEEEEEEGEWTSRSGPQIDTADPNRPPSSFPRFSLSSPAPPPAPFAPALLTV
jgi:hypothetical protein